MSGPTHAKQHLGCAGDRLIGATLILACVSLCLVGSCSSASEPAGEDNLTSAASSAVETVSLSQEQLSLVTDMDGAPQSTTLSVRMSGDALRWRARSDARWLKVGPDLGCGSRDVALRVSPRGLSPGTHQAKVTFEAIGQVDSSRFLRMKYTVRPKRGASVGLGNMQVAVVNSRLDAPLSAYVVDSAGSRLSGVKVVFETVIGTTEPSRLVVESDEAGVARFQPRVLDYGALGITATTEIEDDTPAYFTAVATGWSSTFAGDGVQAWGGDNGPALGAQLNAPFGMALRDNQLIVVDYFNHALRSIDLLSGVIRPLVGTAKQGFNGDGHTALETTLNGPFGIALTAKGDTIFSDYYNNRIRIVEAASGRVSTLAGNGSAGYSGDGGPGTTAKIDVPLDIAIDSIGNIYMSDWHHHVVRMLDARSGVIKTIAGTGIAAYSDDGVAATAALATPLGLSVDAADNLYIADYGSHRVRKVDSKTGLISTVAGTGEQGDEGDGDLAILAKLNNPYNVFVDEQGGLFISDAGNHRIRHVAPKSGVISTIAGQGEFGSSGEQGLATNQRLQGPFSVLKAADKSLYVAEYFGHRIRKVSAAKVPASPATPRTSLLLRQSRQIFGTFPQAAESAENPLSPAKVALGKRLFHDPRLSLDGSVSCGTCHPLDVFGMDGRRVAQGIREQDGTRNSPSVFNTALQDSQFWDGRADTLETQAGGPLLNPKEMAMPDEEAVVSAVEAVPQYRDEFRAAFANDEQPITFRNIRFALAAFERTLLTGDADFDRFIAGDLKALSPKQLLGLEVFLREGCASCHSGPLLGGQNLHLSEEYPNTPAGEFFEFRKKLGNTHMFKVAPLRNIAETAPYLHDGRHPTLESNLGRRLIAYMVREARIRNTVDLAPGELGAMVAFLGALTGKIDPASQP
ncbi:MAG: hypothetical protein GY811_15195 [Myxococcales bacterium]|nr:hypothetical protein [Myxococcales bacterium]